MTPWKVLVVDDEEGIHGITRMIFRGYEFEQRPIELISAMSGAQARELLAQHPDIALALLDVVMETDHEGLQLVDHIRNDLNNQDIRIILRTGHPGYAPEAQVIVNYDINDYLSKAELSASRLLTSVVVALRSYRDIQSARQQPISNPDQTTADNHLLQSAAQQLNSQMQPILQHSQRLQQFELNPVAKDVSANLHAQHQRLHNSISLLEQSESEAPFAQSQLLDTGSLMDQLLHIFLPQSRRDGWLLDYSIDSQLPARIKSDPARLRQLLISAIELAILQASGNDLKLSIKPASKADQILLCVSQTTGQPIFNRSPWAVHLKQQLQQLCQQLNGQLLEIEEDGEIRCLLPL
ncbi:response regulator [Amphritea sp. HPY]|uniref:ATP-binding response regulator n=1 Tax=Amphritea sp. HPY TaxID=3421652 RepID=UPI003D7EC44A